MMSDEEFAAHLRQIRINGLKYRAVNFCLWVLLVVCVFGYFTAGAQAMLIAEWLK